MQFKEKEIRHELDHDRGIPVSSVPEKLGDVPEDSKT